MKTFLAGLFSAIGLLAATGVPAAGAPNGEEIYKQVCSACHASGLAGAPKLGDKAAWAPRIKAGVDAMYSSALKGKGAMPPKGGNMTTPDANIKAAVDFMVSKAK
jgi:cytochrome c5